MKVNKKVDELKAEDEDEECKSDMIVLKLLQREQDKNSISVISSFTLWVGKSSEPHRLVEQVKYMGFMLQKHLLLLWLDR